MTMQVRITLEHEPVEVFLSRIKRLLPAIENAAEVVEVEIQGTIDC